MSQSEDRPLDNGESNVEPATIQLEQGLRTCRAVVRNYRLLIGEEADEEIGAAPEPKKNAAE